MHTVFNQYNKIDDKTTQLVITSTNYCIGVWVDTDIVDQLSQLRWCYEPNKAQVYFTDPSENGDICMKVNSPCRRVYLWKWVGYLKTGTIVKWNRNDLSDYRWVGDQALLKLWG
jgi:hypothetical protein